MENEIKTYTRKVDTGKGWSITFCLCPMCNKREIECYTFKQCYPCYLKLKKTIIECPKCKSEKISVIDKYCKTCKDKYKEKQRKRREQTFFGVFSTYIDSDEDENAEIK